MSCNPEDLAFKVQQLEYSLKQTKDRVNQLTTLEAKIKQIEGRQQKSGKDGGGSLDVWRVEWTIDNIASKIQKMQKNESLWSPEFAALGVHGLQLEFFPNGRENTSMEGFCSAFLWCPSGTTVRYQLGVGGTTRAPDFDKYDGKMGHGHSNFCHLESEIDKEKDCIVVFANILEISLKSPSNDGLVPITGAHNRAITQKIDVVKNMNVRRVEWIIKDAAHKKKVCPRGASLYSGLFTVGGVEEILLEFYPNGASSSTKDGFCAYYIRCPSGTKIVVTLFVGSFKKGPIAATFEGQAGKGLPDFCLLDEQIQADGSLVVGLELTNVGPDSENTTLTLKTCSTVLEEKEAKAVEDAPASSS